MANNDLSVSAQLLNLLEGRLSLSRGTNDTDGNGTPCSPDTPSTLRDLLCSLVGEQVQITTEFGIVAGTLIAVQTDYIVLIETGDQVLVRIEKIESFNEL
nr:hypothetical protein [Bacillaceae bacterium JMAK1]